VSWRSYPFLMLTPAIITGILLHEVLMLPENHFFSVLLFILVVLSVYLVWRRSKTNDRSPLLVVVLLVCFILVGFLNSQLVYFTQQPQISTATLNNCNYFLASIDSKVDKTARSNRYQITLRKIRVDTVWQQLETNAILYASDDVTLNYGDIILVKGRPQFLEHQKNPHAFDYARYLERKGIFLQASCKIDDYILVGNETRSVRYLTLRIGDFFEEILRQHIGTERELNMAKAMVVGRRNEVTPEMENVYEITGTSHILAVSGLHVGIIFILVSNLFKFARRNKLRWLYYAIILFSIWSFAMVTGMSPSVRRAGLMLSFIVIAEMIRRKSNIYNTIFASAFCILLFSPSLIFSVSFQFSYAAVLGIIFLYKKIYALVFVKDRILDFFWQISALSFSVQLATFPINVYYFNQFPSLFPITNLFAIPTAMIVVAGSIGVFVSSSLPVVPDILGRILEYWIFGYNEVLLFFSKLPFASLQNIALKPHYVFLIMALTFLIVRFIEDRKLYLFRIFTIVLCVFSILVFYDYYARSVQTRVVVYAVRGRDYIDIFSGRICFTNTNQQNERTRQDTYFSISPNRKYHLISDIKNFNNMPNAQQIGENTLMALNGKTMLIFHEPHTLTSNTESIHFDFLFLGERSIPYLEYISKVIRCDMLILDASIDANDFEKIANHPFQANKIHYTARDGAVCISI
jgi:competence protein ComEC